MQRNIRFALLAVCVLVLSACSGTPDTMLSPSAVGAATMFVNPDGSTVKVGAPRDLGPNGVTVGTLRPTLSFTNPSGVYATVGYSYDIEVLNAASTVVYARTIGESATSTSHTLESDLTYADNYRHRARVRLGTQVGPWSDLASFRTLDPPALPTTVPPTVAGGGGLPFPIPASCLAGNGAGCSADIAALSAEWGRCRAGDGVGCHRYTRQVAYALSRTDPNWQMIQAAPGGHACNCFSCGPSDGTMFREDTVIYAGRDVYDMIVGAGGPAPGLGWSFVGPPRNVDGPNNAPVCQ